MAIKKQTLKKRKLRGSGAASSAMGRRHILRTRSAPAILQSNYYRAFKTRKELELAVYNYFKDPTKRDEVTAEYGDITNWNTIKITDMYGVFRDIPQISNEPITLNWNTRNVTLMNNMFRGCKQDFKLNFDTGNVISMNGMFVDAINFNQPLPETFNTSKVISMGSMFNNAIKYNQPLPKSFITSNVKYIDGMFSRATSFNQPVKFDTSNVIDMSHMFYAATNFNQPVEFDTSNVQVIKSMFMNATSFNQPVSFNLPNIISYLDIEHIFENTIDLNSSICIRLNPDYNGIIKPEYLFKGSKIMTKGLDMIKIKKNEIRYLCSEAHIIAYSMTEADKIQSELTGKHRQYPTHLIDLDLFNEYLSK